MQEKKQKASIQRQWLSTKPLEKWFSFLDQTLIIIYRKNKKSINIFIKATILNFFSEQKKLKTDLEDLESKMELKSQDEKKRLEREKQEAKEKMNLEIQGWSKRYEELKLQKGQIEKESNNLLKNMEATNLKAVEVIK